MIIQKTTLSTVLSIVEDHLCERGIFLSSGFENLIRIPNIKDSMKYQGILNENLAALLEWDCGCSFQEDSDPKHVSKSKENQALHLAIPVP